jgi:hypothetical protein
MSLKRIGILAAIAMMSVGAAATERYVLQLRDTEFARASAVDLKQLLQRQHRVQVNQYDIRQVVVTAKSFMGRGAASLQVGRARSNELRVHGSPQGYFRSDSRSFDQVVLFSPVRESSRDQWKLNLNGRVKVRQIVVVMDRSRWGRGDDDWRRDDRRPTPPRRGGGDDWRRDDRRPEPPHRGRPDSGRGRRP